MNEKKKKEPHNASFCGSPYTFDGNENDPCDPAFWHRIENMRVGDLCREIMNFLNLKPRSKRRKK